jgi:hypothetical protein
MSDDDHSNNNGIAEVGEGDQLSFHTYFGDVIAAESRDDRIHAVDVCHTIS